MTVSPLPLEVMDDQADELIILPIVGGMVDATVAHLPAAEHDGWYWDNKKWPPARWAGVCGASGVVYNRAGLLEGIEICGACEAAT